MENESIGKRGMGINYKESQGQTKRAVVLEEEEEGHLASEIKTERDQNTTRPCVVWIVRGSA
jgi:hypothetical protein